MNLTPFPPRRRRLFRAESAAQSFSIYLPAMTVYRGLGLVRGLILAWLMVKSEFGLLQVIMLAVSVLTPPCGMGTYEGLARYVPMYETRGQLRSYLARVLPVCVALTLAFTLCVCLGAAPIGRLLFASADESGNPPRTAGEQITLTCLMAAAVLAAVLYFLLLAVLRGMRMFRAVSLMELISNVGFTIIAVAALLLGARTAETIVICSMVSVLAVILPFAWPLHRLIVIVPDQQAPLPDRQASQSGPVGQLLRFSIWAGLAALMWQILQYYPMWYLQKVHGPQVTAVFGGVRQMAQVVLVIAVALTTVVMTAVTKTWEAEGRPEADRKLALAYKSAGLPLVLGSAALAAAAPWIIKLLPGSYAQGAKIIPLSLFFFLICSHLSFLAIHFNLIEKTRHIFGPWAIGVFCNVGFGLLMLRTTQLEEQALIAAAASGALAGLVALLSCVVLLRVERRPLDLGSYLVMGASVMLLLPGGYMAAAAAGLVLLTAATHRVFSREEKAVLWAYAAAARARCFGVRR